MATAVLRNYIHDLIQQRANQQLRHFLGPDITDLTTIGRRYQGQIKHALNEGEQIVNELKSQLYLLASSQQREDAVSRIKIINELFSKLRRAEQSFQVAQKNYQRELEGQCRELHELLDEYLPDLDPLIIYQEIIDSPGIPINLPVIGPTLIRPDELDRRLNLLPFITQELAAIDLSSVQAELTSLCEPVSRSPFYDYAPMLLPLAADAVDQISRLGLLRTPEIDRLADYLRQLLGLDFSIEVSAPDVGEDLLYAELLQLCDRPDNKVRLMELGLQLGYPYEMLQRMAPPELCRTLLRHFKI